MRSALCFMAVGIALHALVAGTPAVAQTGAYVCRSGNVIYRSGRPCNEAQPATANNSSRVLLRQHRAPDERQQVPVALRTPAAMRPADHLSLLSPECARLAEAIRTGSSRGVRYDVVSELQREYSAKCLEEESEARRLWSERQARERDQRMAALRAESAQRERDALKTQQCEEQSRILRGRRARAASMSDGERADLARFEQVFRERCVGG